MLVGAYYVAIFIGSVASGSLGRLYEAIDPVSFWLIHGAIVASGACLLLTFRSGLANALDLSVEPAPELLVSEGTSPR